MADYTNKFYNKEKEEAIARILDDGLEFSYSGGLKASRTGIGTSTTVDQTDTIVGCTAHSITITLGTDAVEEGNVIIVNDESGGAGGTGQAITIDTEGSATIDGSASTTISSNYGSVRLYNGGTNWYTF